MVHVRRLHVLLIAVLLCCSSSNAVPPERGVKQRLHIGPLRQYWEEGHGFCGEMTLQQAGAYHGHYISQRAARWLAGGEVLLSEDEGANMWPLVEDRLGFRYAAFRRVPVAGGGVERFVLFLKQAVAAGMPAVLTIRIEGGESDPPEPYDHIVPLFGFTSPSLTAYSPEDTLTWTTGNQGEVTRSVSDPHFAADGPDTCPFDLDQGGCLNGNADTFNYGMAIGGLHDAHKALLPLQLVITGKWQDGTRAAEEPRSGSVQSGAYSLNLTRAGPFAAGDTYTLYRFCMIQGSKVHPFIHSGRVLANVTGVQQLQALCVKAGDACRSHAVRVQKPGAQVLTAAQHLLGPITARSVVFFVAARGQPVLAR